MKVKISQRSVYHKYAEIEIEVPDNLKHEEVLDYLDKYPQMYEYEIDDALSNAEYEFGFGLDNGMDEKDSESEWRFDVMEKGKLTYGGHL